MTAARPIPPERRGACPALSRPMETGDGLLVRLVPAEGALAPEQVKGLAGAARAFGNGLLEVSARGSLQLRGLSAETIDGLRAAVNALAIAPRESVPLDVSPLAGLDPSETADARPLARRIAAGIAARGLAARLGPKVSVVLDSGGAIPLDALSADVRLVAVPGTAHWALALAGDAATARPFAVLPEAEAAEAVLDLLGRVADLGTGARMADVLAADASLSPTAGGEATPGQERMAPGRAVRPIGRLPLSDGTVAQGIGLPFGQIEAEPLAALADAARRLGARDLRPAPGRALLAVGLSPEGADAFAAEAATLGFITAPDDPRLSVAACPGAPACRSGLVPARAAAGEVAAALAPILDGSITVHLSACAKGCAHPAKAALTLVGMDEGIALVREGTAGAAMRADFPLAALLPRLEALVRAAAEGRRAGEDSRAVMARISPAAAGTENRMPEETMAERKTSGPLA
jgi:precorrin-3B synthase